jgi:hypothetical protein
MTDRAGARANFGDLDFEPTDDQLHALSKEAFADVESRHHAALAALRARIAVLRSEVLEDLRVRKGSERASPC